MLKQNEFEITRIIMLIWRVTVIAGIYIILISSLAMQPFPDDIFAAVLWLHSTQTRKWLNHCIKTNAPPHCSITSGLYATAIHDQLSTPTRRRKWNTSKTFKENEKRPKRKNWKRGNYTYETRSSWVALCFTFALDAPRSVEKGEKKTPLPFGSGRAEAAIRLLWKAPRAAITGNIIRTYVIVINTLPEHWGH